MNYQENLKKLGLKLPEAKAPVGNYVATKISGKMLFISGQIALDPISMKLNNQNIEQETNQVMLNLKNILKEANMDFNNVVKTSIFLSDMSLFSEVNDVYGKYIIMGNEPARETIAVKTLPMNVNVEISMIAVL